MGDAGEALIDAESKIQERMDELARERSERRAAAGPTPEVLQAIGSLRLARLDLERQSAATAHEGRRKVIAQAIAELDRRMAALGGSHG